MYNKYYVCIDSFERDSNTTTTKQIINVEKNKKKNQYFNDKIAFAAKLFN